MNFNVGFNMPNLGFKVTTSKTYTEKVPQSTELTEESYISSKNGMYHFKIQKDGNLCLYTSKDWNPSHCVWSSATHGKGKGPYTLKVQEDGNVCVYGNGQCTWASNTYGKGQSPYMLHVQDDRNVVMYDRNNTPIWSTNTYISQQQFNAPPQQFNAPPQQFNAPPQQFNAPPQQFNAPPQQFNAPPQQFNAPPQQFNAPPQQFNAPPQNNGFNQPSQQFNMPPQNNGFNQPSQQFNMPPQNQGFNQPPQQFNMPPQNQGFNQPPTNSNTKVANSGKNEWLTEKLPMMVKRTGVAGHVRNYSYCFDDFFGLNLNKEFHTPELEEITVYYTNQYVVGIESKFKCMGKNQPINGVPNKSYSGYDLQSKTIKMGFAEHINEISGRCGDYIDKLVIKTSKNQVIDVGGNGGKAFSNLLGFGHHTGIAFGGSYGQFLESIYLIHK